MRAWHTLSVYSYCFLNQTFAPPAHPLFVLYKIDCSILWLTRYYVNHEIGLLILHNIQFFLPYNYYYYYLPYYQKAFSYRYRQNNNTAVFGFLMLDYPKLSTPIRMPRHSIFLNDYFKSNFVEALKQPS